MKEQRIILLMFVAFVQCQGQQARCLPLQGPERVRSPLSLLNFHTDEMEKKSYYTSATKTCTPCGDGSKVNAGGDSCICPPCSKNDTIDVCINLSFIPSTNKCTGAAPVAGGSNQQPSGGAPSMPSMPALPGAPAAPGSPAPASGSSSSNASKSYGSGSTKSSSGHKKAYPQSKNCGPDAKANNSGVCHCSAQNE